MSRPWAVYLPAESASAAARLRLAAGVAVREAGGGVWLRGTDRDDELDRRLKALPGARRFTILSDGALLPDGCRVPNGCLPAGDWRPLTDWIEVSLPTPAFAGRADGKVPLSLVRSPQPGEASLLLTDLRVWHDYAVDAPQVRLDRWRFAAAEDGRVLVDGTPLPPLPGERYVVTGGVAVPAGWTWSPAVDAADVATLLGVTPGDIALCHPDETWELVPEAGFTRATRVAVRLSAREARR